MGQESSKPNELEYQPLRGSDIRLVKLASDPQSGNGMKLTLNHYELDRKPLFIALSYVWGDATKTKPIVISGQSFDVTENLHNALLQIHELLPVFRDAISSSSGSHDADVLLWIDAICINQRDTDEKSKQVPRMADIYSSAMTVLVWLGTLDELGPDGQDRFGLKMLHNAAKEMMPLDNFPDYEISWTWDYDDVVDAAAKFCNTYLRIMRNRWFERVWVVQEYALCQGTACALLGPALFSFEAIFTMQGLLNKLAMHEDPAVRELVAPACHIIGAMVRLSFGPMLLQNRIKSAEFQAKNLAQQLLSVLVSQQGRHCAVPHDQIYGYLGLGNLASLPSALVPNYHLPYQTVYKEYTRFLIEGTGDLRILMFNTNSNLDDQPSWVAEFRKRTPWFKEPPLRHIGKFIAGGEKLQVDGAETGRIIKYWNLSDDLDTDRAAEHLHRFYDEMILTTAVARRRTTAQVWKEWFAGFLVGFTDDVFLGAQFPSAQAFIQSDGGGLNKETILLAFCTQKFAALDDGTVLRCLYRDCGASQYRQDHRVWAFRGSVQRSILRRRADGDGYTYLGWVSEKEDELQLDASYFATRKVRRITIV